MFTRVFQGDIKAAVPVLAISTVTFIDCNTILSFEFLKIFYNSYFSETPARLLLSLLNSPLMFFYGKFVLKFTSTKFQRRNNFHIQLIYSTLLVTYIMKAKFLEALVFCQYCLKCCFPMSFQSRKSNQFLLVRCFSWYLHIPGYDLVRSDHPSNNK